MLITGPNSTQFVLPRRGTTELSETANSGAIVGLVDTLIFTVYLFMINYTHAIWDTGLLGVTRETPPPGSSSICRRNFQLIDTFINRLGISSRREGGTPIQVRDNKFLACFSLRTLGTETVVQQSIIKSYYQHVGSLPPPRQSYHLARTRMYRHSLARGTWVSCLEDLKMCEEACA